MKKNILQTWAVVCLLFHFCFVVATASAHDRGTISAHAYDGGSGTESDPYRIATAAQLSEFASNVNGGTPTAGQFFLLTADITLPSSAWTPIGYSSSSPFNGTFDGDGHSISNLNIQQISGVMTLGFFGRVGAGGTVRHLTIASGNVSGEMCTAAVAGVNQGTLEDCENRANVSCQTYYTGGVAGGNYGTIRDCRNLGNVQAGSYSNGFNAGGITGTNNGTIERCYNTGNITALTVNAGGIAGDCGGTSSIKNCYNRGKVTAPSQLGGLVGQVVDNANSTIINSYVSFQLVEQQAGSGSAGALIGIVLANNITCHTLFYDNTIGASAVGYSTANINTSNMGRSASSMKTPAFVDELSAGEGAGVWMLDAANSNDGFPIFFAEGADIYTITAVADPVAGGTVSGGGDYEAGSTATLTAQPATGFAFLRWTENNTTVSTEATYSFVVTENRTLTAHFERVSYEITTMANPAEGGVVEGAGSYQHGENCTLNATANSNYQFVGWTLAGNTVSDEPTYTFVVEAAGEYVANFVKTENINELGVSSFQIYPNPAVDCVTMEGNELQEIVVMDISGKVVRRIDAGKQSRYTLNINDLATGIYLIVVQSQGGQSTQRLIKR